MPLTSQAAAVVQRGMRNAGVAADQVLKLTLGGAETQAEAERAMLGATVAGFHPRGKWLA